MSRSHVSVGLWRRWIPVSALMALLVLGFAGCTRREVTPTGGRVVIGPNQLSLIPPPAWHVTRLPGMDFRIVSGDAIGMMEPNLLVDGVYDHGEVHDIAGMIVQRYRTRYPDYLHSDMAASPTAAVTGDAAVRWTASRGLGESGRIALVHYLVSMSGSTVVITGSCDESTQARCIPLMDVAVATVRMAH